MVRLRVHTQELYAGMCYFYDRGAEAEVYTPDDTYQLIWQFNFLQALTPTFHLIIPHSLKGILSLASLQRGR